MTMNQEVVVEPNESQMTLSDQPPEGTVEDVMGWSEWYLEVQTMVARNSS
jgi:hypothetical protein